MYIAALVWDEENVDHIAHHSVTAEEVEEVWFGRHVAIRGRHERYVLYGQTESGRYVFVVLERIKGGLFRPITAREMSEAEKSAYRRRV